MGPENMSFSFQISWIYCKKKVTKELSKSNFILRFAKRWLCTLYANTMVQKAKRLFNQDHRLLRQKQLEKMVHSELGLLRRFKHLKLKLQKGFVRSEHEIKRTYCDVPATICNTKDLKRELRSICSDNNGSYQSPEPLEQKDRVCYFQELWKAKLSIGFNVKVMFLKFFALLASGGKPTLSYRGK